MPQAEVSGTGPKLTSEGQKSLRLRRHLWLTLAQWRSQELSNGGQFLSQTILSSEQLKNRVGNHFLRTDSHYIS